MNTTPWKKWIPGVLSKHQIKQLCKLDHIECVGENELDHSSIDLTLGDTGYPSAASRPLTLHEAAELRGKFAAWEEDRNAPGMEAYDRAEARDRTCLVSR